VEAALVQNGRSAKDRGASPFLFSNFYFLFSHQGQI
jgi:hypothetical protein